MPASYILLFGGESDERLVSFASAQHMGETLKNARLWYWHDDGKIFEISRPELLEHQNPFTVSFAPKASPLFSDISQAIAHPSTKGALFVLGLHGGAGENGELQERLEQAGLRFTGSNSSASRLAFDKVATKAKLAQHDIKMAPQIVFDRDSKSAFLKSLHSFFDEHGETILKPICGGSTLGCTFIRTKGQIDEIAEKPFTPYMAEKIITGCEVTVGVISRAGKLLALPPTEIALQKNRDFDYEGKYLGLGTQEITPARISQAQTAEAQKMALAAHQALNLSGYSRSDMIFGPDGLYFLETNTLPGLTRQSLIPKQLAAAGITMGDFLQEQVSLAGDPRGSL